MTISEIYDHIKSLDNLYNEKRKFEEHPLAKSGHPTGVTIRQTINNIERDIIQIRSLEVGN